MTHLGADWNLLKSILEQNPKMQVFQTDIQYFHHEDLKKLWDHSHRNDNAAAWWADVLVKNKDFASKELAKYCKYIYLVAGPECLPKINMDPVSAAAYYRFRLRGLSQWHQRSGGPWICESDLHDDCTIARAIGEVSPNLVFDFKTEPQKPQIEIASRNYGTLMEECTQAYHAYSRAVKIGTPVVVE